jgi:CBS domain containing-hemolysin-like protein
MTEVIVPIGIILGLILFNGIFVAAEFSIVSAPRTRIAQSADRGNSAAQHTLKVLLEPVLQNRYIATAQIGITLVTLGLGSYGEHILADWILIFLEDFSPTSEALAHTIASVISVVLMTYLHVVIGEMIPKSLALQAAEPTVLALARPMSVFQILFFPFVWTLNVMGNGIVRLLGVPPAEGNDRLFTAEELDYIVEESLEGGMLDSSEQLFIENIFDLSDRNIEQIMTPRTQVHGILVGADEKTILRRICETRKSRYPVYEDDIDHIIGILHIKDFARARRSTNGSLDLKAIVRPATFVPENLVLDRMLLSLQKENIQLAIVIDEFGGTAGIVSMEDLVEEVVGEIQDEFDREILPIQEVSDKLLRVRGDLLLDELSQHYELDFDETEAHTVGGLVMELLGRIPHPKDVVETKGIRFEVESTERLAVQSVLIHLQNHQEEEEEGSE